MSTHPPIPDNNSPDKRLQFLSHAGLLYVTCEHRSVKASMYYLRTMHSHRIIDKAANIYDLRVVGDEYVEAHSA